MKFPIIVITVLLAVSRCAAVTFSSGTLNTGIPDGNPSGISSTINVSGIANPIRDINVTLNISGGANGDLYVYLVHQSGYVVLLNRVGTTASNPFGYGDAGLHVTFDDQASQSTDIHNYQTVVGYSITGGANWRPDGRNVDPQTVVNTDPRTTSLGSFNGLDPNGSWTIFLADMSGGDVSTLVSWGLDITPVPEPTTIAMGIFGIAGLAFAIRKHLIKTA